MFTRGRAGGGSGVLTLPQQPQGRSWVTFLDRSMCPPSAVPADPVQLSLHALPRPRPLGRCSPVSRTGHQLTGPAIPHPPPGLAKVAQEGGAQISMLQLCWEHGHVC